METGLGRRIVHIRCFEVVLTLQNSSHLLEALPFIQISNNGFLRLPFDRRWPFCAPLCVADIVVVLLVNRHPMTSTPRLADPFRILLGMDWRLIER